jgi:hypothetical protein
MFTKVLHKLYTGLANQKERIDEVMKTLLLTKELIEHIWILNRCENIKVFVVDQFDTECGNDNCNIH